MLEISVICIVATFDSSSALGAVVLVGVVLGSDVTLEVVKNSIESLVD